MELINRAEHSEDGRKRVRYVFATGGTCDVGGAYMMTRQLQENGKIAPYGCDCRICRNDGDCCGRFTLSSMKSVLAGDRLIVLQRFYRNL